MIRDQIPGFLVRSLSSYKEVHYVVGKHVYTVHTYQVYMLWYGLGKAGNYLRNRKLFRFRIIRMAFCIRDYHKKETGESRIVRCHHDSGNNKADSLLRLLRSKVSNHHGLAK